MEDLWMQERSTQGNREHVHHTETGEGVCVIVPVWMAQ